MRQIWPEQHQVSVIIVAHMIPDEPLPAAVERQLKFGEFIPCVSVASKRRKLILFRRLKPSISSNRHHEAVV